MRVYLDVRIARVLDPQKFNFLNTHVNPILMIQQLTIFLQHIIGIICHENRVFGPLCIVVDEGLHFLLQYADGGRYGTCTGYFLTVFWVI